MNAQWIQFTGCTSFRSSLKEAKEMKQIKAYIGGNFVLSSSDQKYLHIDPYDLKVLYEWNDSLTLLEECLENSRGAFNEWRRTPLESRVQKIQSFAEALKKRELEIAIAISKDMGKAKWEAQTEAKALVKKIEISCGPMLELVKQLESAGKKEGSQYFQYQPKGPCLVLGPFNFPLHLPNGQIIPALLMGNSIIFKPSEYANASASIYAEAAQASELPPSLLQVLPGKVEVSKALVKDSRIKAVLFTGSFENGKSIQKTILLERPDLSTGVALEMGGKNAIVIHEDSPYEQALYESLYSAYATTGQRCSCASRLLVHETLFSKFIQDFKNVVKNISFGNPQEDSQFMGPLVHQQAFESFKSNMAGLDSSAAECVFKSVFPNEKSCLAGPSFHAFHHFSDALKSEAFKKEFFGPNTIAVPYKDREELVQLHESSAYGLVASVYTQSEEFFKFCDQNFQVGLLNWNRPTIGASSELPFGGIKQSGNNWPVGIFAFMACVYPRSYLENHSTFSLDQLPQSLAKVGSPN